MKGKNITKQLNSLKEIKADAGWKAKNRELLLNQIYGSQADSQVIKNDWVFYFRLPLMMAREVSQPTLVAFLIFVFLAGGTFTSVRVARNTKPGDSLYIAKIASEKTQFALTFDQKEKAKLGISFANNRVDEINQVLAETSSDSNNAKVDTLIKDLKQQIGDVKTRIAKISPTAVNQNNNAEEGSEVFSASFNKDANGLQVSDGNGTAEKRDVIATATPPTATTTAAVSSMTDTANILKEAKQLLDEEKYNDTLEKLDQVDKSVTQADQTEAKNETATSTTK